MEFKLLEGGKTESQSKKWDCPSDEAAKPEAPCHDPPYPKATSAEQSPAFGSPMERSHMNEKFSCGT